MLQLCRERNTIVGSQTTSTVVEIKYLWEERYPDCREVRLYPMLWKEGILYTFGSGGKEILTCWEVRLYIQLWRKVPWKPTAVRRKVPCQKSDCTWSWVMVRDGLPTECSNSAPLWGTVVAAELGPTLLREFPSRALCFFSAPARVVTSLLHSAKDETPSET